MVQVVIFMRSIQRLTPEADVRESAITGTATLEKFVGGAVLSKGMASPTGFGQFRTIERSGEIALAAA